MVRSDEAVFAELALLAGARIQRVDRIDPRTWVFELRAPGRTLRMMVRAGPEPRVHLVPRRPPRRVDGGDAQRRVRKRTGGQALVELATEGRFLVLDLERARVSVDLHSAAVRIEDHAPRAPPPAPGLPERFVANEEAAARGAEAADRREKEAMRRAALTQLRSRRKKQQRLVEKVEADVARLEALAAEEARGELLKSVLHTVRRGQPEVTCTDWSTGESVVLSLRPELSPAENLQRIFERSKRGRRGVRTAGARRDEALRQLRAIDDEIDRIAALDLEALDVDALRPLLGGAGVFERRARSRAADPIDRWSRRFTAIDGREIRVGRGAKENDRLTLQGARGHDRWLHLRGASGAHVILRCEPGREPDAQALLDAAHLAVHYSSASREARADVIVAEARHVKKTKGAPPGQVGVSKGRTLHVVIEPDRLRRLFDGEGSPS